MLKYSNSGLAFFIIVFLFQLRNFCLLENISSILHWKQIKTKENTITVTQVLLVSVIMSLIRLKG